MEQAFACKSVLRVFMMTELAFVFRVRATAATVKALLTDAPIVTLMELYQFY